MQKPRRWPRLAFKILWNVHKPLNKQNPEFQGQAPPSWDFLQPRWRRLAYFGNIVKRKPLLVINAPCILSGKITHDYTRLHIGVKYPLWYLSAFPGITYIYSNSLSAFLGITYVVIYKSHSESEDCLSSVVCSSRVRMCMCVCVCIYI